MEEEVRGGRRRWGGAEEVRGGRRRGGWRRCGGGRGGAGSAMSCGGAMRCGWGQGKEVWGVEDVRRGEEVRGVEKEEELRRAQTR